MFGADVIGRPHLFHLEQFGDYFQRVGLAAKGEELGGSDFTGFFRRHGN